MEPRREQVRYFTGDCLHQMEYVGGRLVALTSAAEEAHATGRAELMVTSTRRSGTPFKREVLTHALAIFESIIAEMPEWQGLQLEMEDLRPTGKGMYRVVAKLVVLRPPQHTVAHRRADDSPFDEVPLPHAS